MGRVESIHAMRVRRFGQVLFAGLILMMVAGSGCFSGLQRDGSQDPDPGASDTAANQHTPNAGWLAYLQQQAEAGALLEQTAEDEASAAAAALDRLASWRARIDIEPGILAAQRGVIEWAYLSEVDGHGLPFTLAIPDAYDPRETWPLEIYLHGFGSDHRSNAEIGAAHPAPYFHLFIHGRTRGVGYHALGETDVLEAMAFVLKHWQIDPDRVHLTGSSMGGFGAFRLATRHPDLFASVRPMAASGLLLPPGNLIHLPLRALHGADDGAVPAAMVEASVRALAEAGGDASVEVVPGAGHGLASATLQLARDRQWSLQQRRPETVRHIRYEAVDAAAPGAYWAHVLEWGREGRPASFDARLDVLVDDERLRLELDNVAQLQVNLARSPARSERDLEVIVNGQSAGHVPAPLPEHLYVCLDSLGGAAISPEAPAAPAFRLHAPGGQANLFQGEPLLVVWGTGGTPDETQTLYRVAQAAANSADGKWPDPQTQRQGEPLYAMVHGRHPSRPDTAVSTQDLQKYNVLLLGMPAEGSLISRLVGELPIQVAGDRIRSNDGIQWPWSGHGFGLLHYNPEAPQRLVYWIAAADVSFYRLYSAPPLTSLTAIGAGLDGAPDLLVLDTAQRRLAAARRFDSRWNWEAGYAASPIIHADIPVAGREAVSIASAVRRLANADVGMTRGADWYSMDLRSQPGVTRRMDVTRVHYGQRIGTLELTRAQLQAAAAAFEARESGDGPDNPVFWKGMGRFDPPPSAGQDPDGLVRIAFPEMAMFSFGRYAGVSTNSFRLTDLTVREAMVRYWEPWSAH